MHYRVGLDLGGTNIVGGLVNEHDEVVGLEKVPTEAARGSESVLRRMAELVEGLIETHRIPRAAIEAVGAGIPGLVNPLEGVCIGAANLQWRDVPAAARLSELLGLPVFIDNDVRAYVLGEALFGAGRGHRVVLGVTLGTGIASALIMEGRPYYGARMIAGELGHIYMEGELGVCGCGRTGCLETVASATGLTRQAREQLAAGRPSLLAALALTPEAITAAHITEAYDRGDAVAVELMRHTGRLLGRALSYAVTLYNPDVIVVGGGVAQAGERLLAPAREELALRALGMYTEGLALKATELGDRAGVLGAAAHAARMRRDAAGAGG
ncbi:ROK family protein [Paenibacillus sp. HJGM_3]|uniref:ROK family protein n=1 Tax=Paenibacillus sp. HJGM_3 TaxID=3379816 RepID=UPI0038598AD7